MTHSRYDLKPDAVELRSWLVYLLLTLSERTLFVSVSMLVREGVRASVLEIYGTANVQTLY